jgi:GTP-binding protein HflX
LTGGIGGRGPGETKLEIGRRRARERVTRLERELAQLGKQRSERRRNRVRGDSKVIALVGYTNAGKSTLLNALTGASVLAEDKLFATLDTRARQLFLPHLGNAVLTDTVGFIRDMPKDLFAAFRATFEEAADADLLLEVVDAASTEQDDHQETTAVLLDRLGLGHIPRLIVLTKFDCLKGDEQEALRARLSRGEASAKAVTVSAPEKLGLDSLLSEIERLLGGVAKSPTAAALCEPEAHESDESDESDEVAAPLLAQSEAL